MKTKIEINGQKVEITLTPEQVAEIKAKAVNYEDLGTIEAVFEYLGMNYEEWKEKHEELEDHVQAYMELTYVAKAYNGGEWMDYDDTDVTKYYPYFNASGSAAGFSCGDYYFDRSDSVVGSRLCFKDSARAMNAGKKFLKIYDRYINPRNK